MIQVQLRPILPLSIFRSRLFLTVSGVVSLLVPLFMSAVYVVLICGIATYSDVETQFAWFSGFITGPIAVAWILICTVGPAVIIAMLDHMLPNRSLSSLRRLFWLIAIASGFGMIFYWYFHLFAAIQSEGNGAESQ